MMPNTTTAPRLVIELSDTLTAIQTCLNGAQKMAGVLYDKIMSLEDTPNSFDDDGDTLRRIDELLETLVSARDETSDIFPDGD